MKANELRIGNLFLHGETLVEVSVIHRTHFYCETIGRINHGNSLQERFEPIPLTEEWLLKFGFEKQGHVKFIGEAYDRFVLGRNGIYSVNKLTYIYEVNDHDLCELKYVHQLKNLYFALTDEELITQLKP